MRRDKADQAEMGNWSGRSIVAGDAAGELLWSDVPLSFWGGVDPALGSVVDRHHPLFGQSIADKILAIPGSRGSCTGSAVLLELLLARRAPAAIVVSQSETVLPLGAFVAEALFGISIPVLSIAPEVFSKLASHNAARIAVDRIIVAGRVPDLPGILVPPHTVTPHADLTEGMVLSDRDRALLFGAEGEASKLAMRIVLRMARLMGAERLIDVVQAHIDGCIYTGPASLQFAERLCSLGAQVSVPTTLNAISADERRWREQGLSEVDAVPALKLAHAYVAMGAAPTYTCAPYQLASAPKRGEHIAWAESNAVAFANSIIGARTEKYPDFLDACIAITGRAPLSGCHLDDGRRATTSIDVLPPKEFDDAFYPLLGHRVGELSPDAIPVVTGLERLRPTSDDLRAFAAAFATTSNAPMFHIVGVTPEASDIAAATGGKKPGIHHNLGRAELAMAWRAIDGAAEERIDCVSLGNPHFSAKECQRLANMALGRQRSEGTLLLIALSRHTMAETQEAVLAELVRFGARFINDTCWCMIGEPVIPPSARVILTNSAKYAHYGPGLVGRSFRFGSLAQCVEAACSGQLRESLPAWLAEPPTFGE